MTTNSLELAAPPASPPREREIDHAAAQKLGATVPSALRGAVRDDVRPRLRHWLSDVDGAVALARQRLELAIAALGERGVRARGEVGDANPLFAIDDALAAFAADEIVIATLPPGRSNWIERGLIERARARFGVPIAHLVARYEVVEEDARHAPARAAA